MWAQILVIIAELSMAQRVLIIAAGSLSLVNGIYRYQQSKNERGLIAKQQAKLNNDESIKSLESEVKKSIHENIRLRGELTALAKTVESLQLDEKRTRRELQQYRIDTARFFQSEPQVTEKPLGLPRSNSMPNIRNLLSLAKEPFETKPLRSGV